MDFIADRDSIEQALEQIARRHRVPGMVAGILQGGRQVVGVTGITSVQHRRPMEPETAMQVASVTKLFTAMAVLQLVEQGRVDLDRPLGEQGIAAPLASETARERLSLRHLLSHQGGFASSSLHLSGRDYGNDDGALGRMIGDFDQLEQWTWPGQAYCYNNHGFDLTGFVIETITGQPYEDILRRTVFQPAGVAARFIQEIHPSNAVATGHQLDADNTPVPLPWGEAKGRSSHPSGGLVISAKDLLTISGVLLSDRTRISPILLSPDTIDAMWTPISGGDMVGQSHGLGWSIHETDAGRVVGHTGTNPGFKSVLTLLPAQDAALVVLANTDDDNAVPEMEAWLLRHIFGIRQKAAVPHGTAISLGYGADEVAGVYGENGSTAWAIGREQGELVFGRLQEPGMAIDWIGQLEPIAPGRFRVLNGSGRFRDRAITVSQLPDAARGGEPAWFLYLGQSFHRRRDG